MQFPEDTALAAALAAGQERRFSWSFRVDWTRDGTFSDPNADLSNCVDNWDVDRQLVGNVPAELAIAEGHAAAQAWVTLSGPAPDGTPVYRLFSPYSGLYPGTVAAIDSPCELDLVVETTEGPKTIRQFTGFVRHATPSRRTGTVVLVLRDAATRLAAPIDLPTWAVDGYLRRRAGDEYPDWGGIALSWLVDHILRESGWMQGLPWHPDVLLAWTLNGSALPSVGHFGIFHRWVTGTYDFGYLRYLMPSATPAGAPDDVWEVAPTGVAFRGFHMPDWVSLSQDNVRGNAFATRAPINPLSHGGNSSNLLGFSAQFKLDTSTANAFLDRSAVKLHISDLRYDFGSSNQYPCYAELSLLQSTGALTFEFRGEGWAKIWRWTATIPPTPTRWVNVYLIMHSTPSAITPHLFVDGAEVALTPTTTAAWPPPVITYTFADGASNNGFVLASGPMQYAQIWYQHDTPYAQAVPPSFTPPAQAARVDLSSLKLTHIPKTYQRPAWELLRELAAADLGALYVTEHGVPSFDSRATIMGRRVVENVSRILTLDDIADADPSTMLESVVNVISWTLDRRVAEIARQDGTVAPTPVPAVFQAERVNQFETPAGTLSQLHHLTLSQDIMQVRQGAVTYRPQAMGYKEDGSASLSWESTMQFYSPQWWADGFTPYRPGSRTDPSLQPIPNGGVNAGVRLGWQTWLDFDPAHITISTSNSSVNTAWFAVDDSTPFLHVSGVRVVDANSGNEYAGAPPSATVRDEASVATFGLRPAVLPGGGWLQDAPTVTALAQGLLFETAQPTPYFESLEVIGDPRTQLQDVHRVDDPMGLGGPIFASVVGIRRRCSRQGGLTDSLLLRTFGDSGLWIMGDEDYSIMGTTTIVG